MIGERRIQAETWGFEALIERHRGGGEGGKGKLRKEE